MEQEYKKTAVDLTDLALGIVTLGIVVAIGATILIGIRNNQVTSLPTGQVVNETITANGAGATLTKGWVKSMVTVLNGTNAVTISSGNYTLSINAEGVGSLSNNTCEGSGFRCDGPWRATYNVYNTSDPRYALPQNASIGIGEYGNWFKIIVIVGVAALVLSIIFMAFGRHGGEDGGVAY
jgi:hypothetical protein